MKGSTTGTLIFCGVCIGVVLGLGSVYVSNPVNVKQREIEREREHVEEMKELDFKNKSVQDALPPGCAVKFYGYYYVLPRQTGFPIVAVVCKKQDTTSLNWMGRSGKIVYPETRFTIMER